MGKGTRVASYPDLFLGDDKITITIVSYINETSNREVYYGFQFKKDMNTQKEGKTTLASQIRSLEQCKKICEKRISELVYQGWKNPFSSIQKQAEQKKIINFLDKYG